MRRAILILILACGTVYASDLPDPKLTPGVTNPVLTREKLCAPGFRTGPFRHVTASLKAQVYAAYHARNHQGICAGKEGCEVDHLISLEIGGANAFGNLWPQPFGTKPWNAHVKDKLENALHREVCAGQTPLEEAQRVISKDWIAAYRARFGEPK
jgi:hypothetical protein